MIIPIFLIFTLLVNQIHSVSVVNNVTVNSDILSEMFYNEIRNNQNLFNAANRHTKVYNSELCLNSLKEILKQFPNLKVLPFFDAWGKFPSGLLYGNTYDIGNFDQCVKTSIDLSDVTGTIDGQFCFAKIPLINQQALIEPPLRRVIGAQPLDEQVILQSLSINIGICVPQSCSEQFLTSIFQKSFANVLDGALSGVSVSRCTNGKTPPLKSMNIIGISIFSFFGLLMVLSSLYDFFMTVFEKTPAPILLAFSVLTNGKKLMAINTKRSPNSIDCLTGIRVFSMFWIVYAHTYLIASTIPTINTIDIKPWLVSLHSLEVINGSMAVDSFFFISGLLVAWLGFRELDRTKGKLNVIMMYIHRYIRLTPLVAAGLLFIFSLNKIIGNGPFRKEIAESETCDGSNWWSNILYIQNYYIQETKCFSRTWYLAVDFQLYVLSPLLLIPMWKWGKKFAPVLVVLALMSIACVMTIFITNEFRSLRGINTDEWDKTYVPMHTRCSPWLVGFGLGYFMHINRQRIVRIPKVIQLLGWIASFFILIAVVHGTYFSIRAHGKGTVFEAAIYEGWRRVSWAIALAWITFACHFGYGGIVDGILSHPFWQPLGRLTYALYLVHSFVLRINFGMTRTALYFSTYEQILRFCGAFGISVLVSAIVSLAFESPIIILEKFIFRRDETKKATSVKPLDQPGIDSQLSHKEV